MNAVFWPGGVCTAPVRTGTTRMSALSLDLFTCDIFVKIEEESDESSWVEVRRRPVRNKSSLRSKAESVRSRQWKLL
jgi:hypothetical protein